MDKIIIKDAKVFCKIGVSSAERSKKQAIFVDLQLFFNLRDASLEDEIKKTIDYSKVFYIIKKTAMKKSYKLIETLAENIADAVLKEFEVGKIILRVKKPLNYAKYCAVEITRRK